MLHDPRPTVKARAPAHLVRHVGAEKKALDTMGKELPPMHFGPNSARYLKMCNFKHMNSCIDLSVTNYA